jgi:uncharacterized protein (DUF4213/DUF364 family)
MLRAVRGRLGEFHMSKTIVDELLAYLKDEVPSFEDIRVDSVCLGWGYTGVQLSTGDMGLCHSLLGEAFLPCCQIVKQAGTLTGCSAAGLAERAKSWDLGERVVGLATISALSQIIMKRRPERFSMMEGNILDQLGIKPTDTVAMVGNIKPIVEPIRRKTSSLLIFERSGRFDEGVLPDTACEELLPDADVVLITGSAIANGTIERLLQLSQMAREVGVLGPSASIIPDPLFNRGVDLVGGVIVTNADEVLTQCAQLELSGFRVIVTNADEVLRIIAEGGGTPQLRAAVRFVTMRPKCD